MARVQQQHELDFKNVILDIIGSRQQWIKGLQLRAWNSVEAANSFNRRSYLNPTKANSQLPIIDTWLQQWQSVFACDECAVAVFCVVILQHYF